MRFSCALWGGGEIAVSCVWRGGGGKYVGGTEDGAVPVRH